MKIFQIGLTHDLQLFYLPSKETPTNLDSEIISNYRFAIHKKTPFDHVKHFHGENYSE